MGEKKPRCSLFFANVLSVSSSSLGRQRSVIVGEKGTKKEENLPDKEKIM